MSDLSLADVARNATLRADAAARLTDHTRAVAVRAAREAHADMLETHPYQPVNAGWEWDYAVEAAFAAKRDHGVSVYMRRNATGSITFS